MHSPYVESVFEKVSARNTNEPLFIQAVQEFLESIDPVVETMPQAEEFNLVERMCEPERQVIFKVVWHDDNNIVHVNRGYRLGFNSALGPYKGGLRFHPTVNLGVMKFLAFEQVFKNSLTGLQIGGGKGGSDFNPRGRSDREIMRFCQSFMNELYRHIGDRSDVPAGDIGVGSREIGYLFGQYKRLTQRYDLSVLTGKGEEWGGSLVRKEATGYGCVYFAAEMLQNVNEKLTGKVAIVSGSGNVALYTIQKLQQLGAKVVACSDSEGYIYDPSGLDLPALIKLKEVERKRVSEYLDTHPKAEYKPKGVIWEIPCDLAFPCATQNEITECDAKTLVKNGCRLVCEGANMPTTNEGIKILQENGVLFGPAKAANAGGVAVSALEMQQNVTWANWTFEDVDNRLHLIMKRIHETCLKYAAQYNNPGNYVAGANIGGFLRVAKSMIAHGVV
ncbi:MAG: NADP-specific glutamate dehydrogenase [Verrucomicrobia bacterium CG_4_9_14_3_um_filter_43_20]|nr:MAG: glutamate dehydrogenase [Verrucomicrobia bacterium CG1_02_43_26]PIP59677.1 MAG: NADP-specific glutamate dehydrogenase [Verrucomicrobia bacterium CG22_combo_CG10-13_8_21_14_all_43_17]PIY61098.1 MAG: NADP-specific glutamate dehydrogenase [Verrucomicrobia bacterium CG_4_10_14_0_8_um_filter_43_34]PJA43841.1 MAG: NADP-specific glutamate dehydrogenase [Verrucomicrobia bacterium CG_4_9_14_3_um_filter_43_20]